MLRFSFRTFFASAISLGACALGGCAIHPLPENVTGVKTSQIVHRNRCEARDAIGAIYTHLTRKMAERPAERAKYLRALNSLKQIGVVLSYALDMTESDGVAANSNFQQAITRGTFSFNPSAGDALKRENKRVFTVADNYMTLGAMRNCSPEPAGSNYQYPIVGTVGIEETVRSFLTMALHEDLNGAADANKPPNDPSKSIAGSPTMVETLTFTTTLNAGITPMISLTPVGRATQLTSASLAFTWMRQDVHTVIVGLGLPTVPAPEFDGVPLSAVQYKPYSLVASARGNSARARTPLLIDAAVPATTVPGSGTAVALEAVNNQIIRFEALQNTVIIAQ